MVLSVESVYLESLGIVAAAIFTWYMYLKYSVYNYWKKRGVVQVEPTVPFGNLWATIVGTISIGEYFSDAYNKFKHNQIFGVYSFHKPNLVICDPDAIRYVLTKDFHYFHDRGLYCNTKIDPLSGNLFLLPGRKWKILRGKLTPTFTSGKIRNMFDTLKNCGDELSSILTKTAESSDVVEVKDILARFSTDVIASTAFGIHCNSIKDPNSEFRNCGRKMLPTSSFKNTLGLFAPTLLDLLSIPTIDKSVSRFLINAFNETVAYRRANRVLRNDFLDLMMQLIDTGHVEDEGANSKVFLADEKHDKINDLDGAAQAYAFFLGGSETSSSTATHCLYELAINPEIQERVREDIDKGIEGAGDFTYESLNNMPYLHKVVSETLRKYPSIPLLNRICTHDYILPTTGLHIPNGTPVIIPVLGLHSDPHIYTDPEKFDPERFSEENIASRHPYAYLPFGEGPRSCIGIRFGLVQTKVALISLLRKYRFKPGPKTQIPLEEDRGSFVLTPKGGMHLRIEAR